MDDIYLGAALGVAVGFLVGIILHHVAHARAAVATGDRSVKLSGRMSLSIKRHADVLGTYILVPVWAVVILFNGAHLPMFAWGQPQAGNPYLQQNRKNVIIQALAGPVATLALAIVAGVGRRAVSGQTGAFLGGICVAAVCLTVFEILPIPGRDGGRILAQFLSPTGRMRFTELAEYHAAFILGILVIPELLNFGNPMIGFANLLCEPITGADCVVLTTEFPLDGVRLLSG